MMQKRRFVIRTIRNGRVKIFGKSFVPNRQFMEYDGRLDGMRYAFGLYWYGPEWQDDFVALWGSEEMYRAVGEADDESLDDVLDEHWQPERMPEEVDGKLPWYWWDQEDR